MKRTTLSFLTESKASAVGFSAMRRVAMTLLVMLLTTASVWAQVIIPTIYRLSLNANYQGGALTMVDVPVSEPTTTYTLTQNDEPIGTDYIFEGWSKSSTGEVEYKTGDQVILTGNLTLYAIWSNSVTYNSIKYEITGAGKKQVKVSRYIGEEPSGTLNIPATVPIKGTEYSVTSIGDYAFSDCSSLQSVTIPNSVTSIGIGVFHQCSSLQSVTIPKSVTSIGNYAFWGCSNLQSVTIPNSVTSIGNHAFESCSSLQSVTIPNSVTSIGDYAFENCDNLQSVTINGNPKIGGSAFRRTTDTVTMNLTASPIDRDYWTTFYNDGYNFQADGNTTVYKGTVNESSLMLTEVEDKIVNSGTAVILKSSGNPVMTLTKSGSSDTNGNDLRGIRDRTLRTSVISNFSANEIYTMGNTSVGFGFHRYTGEFVPAGKAFLPLNTSDGAKAQSLTIVFAIGATGINSVSSDSNVQNDWFSLDGTRLSGKPSQPGIYVNGKKKVVIK